MVPASFSEFSTIKNSGGVDWEELKHKYALKSHYDLAINKGDLSPLVGFSLYIKMDTAIKEKLHGLTTTNGITVTGHSYHFIDRIFGSIEQKRSGVSVESARRTILDGKDFKKFEKSTKINGKDNTVSINHITGNLIQVNPRKEVKVNVGDK
ncbi:MAG: hypothetical protein FWG24_03985 [Eggerthellaceae bacterium]|nr:hypothetical protein [Eggerthellaceae bacterium]